MSNKLEKIKGSNAVGLYQNKLKNGDVSYFFTLKINGKLKWFPVGLRSNGYRLEHARKARQDKYNEIHNIQKQDTQKLGRVNRTIPVYDEVMREFIESKTKNKLKTKTYDNYLGTYIKRVEPFIGDTPIDQVTQKQVEDIVSTHMKSETDPLSLKSLNTIVDVIGMVVRYAINKDIFIGKDVTADIDRFKIDNIREKWLDMEEVSMLLEYTKENVEDNNIFMCILLCVLTGARINNIVNLKVSDIDLKKKRIKLFDDKNDTQKSYYGYFTEKYYDTIAKQVNHAKSLKSKLLLTDGSKDKNRVRYYSQRRIQPILDELFNKDVDKKDRKNRVVAHNLRHSFGSILINNNVELHIIQDLMHHKDSKMTKRYAKMNDETKRKGIESLDF